MGRFAISSVGPVGARGQRLTISAQPPMLRAIKHGPAIRFWGCRKTKSLNDRNLQITPGAPFALGSVLGHISTTRYLLLEILESWQPPGHEPPEGSQHA